MRRSRLVGLVLALSSGACSRSSGHEPPSASGKPSAAPSARAAEPVRDPLAAASKSLPPPVTPIVPPQLVACGERDFYRITPTALEVFEIASVLPPPQIRGGRVAIQTNEVAIVEPLNVFSPSKKRAIVIAKGTVLRYEFDEKRAKSYAPIAAAGPLVAWPDARRSDSFHVHVAGTPSVQDFTLTGPRSAEAGSPPPPPQVARNVTALPGFDARLFTVLTDGMLLYSTPSGLVRRGREAPGIPFRQSSGPATSLFADPSASRYWAADASGKLSLLDQEGAPPLATASVRGVVIDTAVEGDRVAVLSVEVVGQSYSPTVTVFSNGKEQARLTVGTNVAARGQPKLDLCLIAGRPWVLVSNAASLQLLDWSSRRLLSEW